MRKTFTKETKESTEVVDESEIEHDLEDKVAKVSISS